MALTLTDLLLRRVHVCLEAPGHAVGEAADLVELVAPELGWDADRKATELAAYLREVRRMLAFRSELHRSSQV
jgi:glycerol-3-phosphate dehydrogenase